MFKVGGNEHALGLPESLDSPQNLQLLCDTFSVVSFTSKKPAKSHFSKVVISSLPSNCP